MSDPNPTTVPPPLPESPSPQPISPTPPIEEAYLIFCGGIDLDASRRIANALAISSNPTVGVKRVHLLLQTFGGSVSDGIFLYNLLRTYPVDLTIYNVGTVQSIGVLIFLGAKKRKTSASATFLVHRTTTGAQYAKASTLKALAKSTDLDDQRTEKILKAHVKWPKETWSELDQNDITFSGEEAVKYGIADEVGEFAPPKGTQVFFIGATN